MRIIKILDIVGGFMLMFVKVVALAWCVEAATCHYVIRVVGAAFVALMLLDLLAKVYLIVKNFLGKLLEERRRRKSAKLWAVWRIEQAARRDRHNTLTVTLKD